jgi:hypothetical protein
VSEAVYSWHHRRLPTALNRPVAMLRNRPVKRRTLIKAIT